MAARIKNEDEPMSSPAKKVKKEEKTPSKPSIKKPIEKKMQVDEGDARPSKRMKIDHDEQVSQLFQAAAVSKESTLR
jgi:hypothetical protein